MMEDLRYPTGPMPTPENVTPQQLKKHIETIKSFPAMIKKATSKLKPAQLNTVYREGGWMIKQVVHHTADSHCNAYLRFKLALTEPNPAIKPYFESDWARLPDANENNLQHSYMLLEGLHHRWVLLMQNMTPRQWGKTYYHPQQQETFSLRTAAAMYAWHCEHHLAHITNLKKRKGWK